MTVKKGVSAVGRRKVCTQRCEHEAFANHVFLNLKGRFGLDNLQPFWWPCKENVANPQAGYNKRFIIIIRL